MITCRCLDNILEWWQQISTLLVNAPPPPPLILHRISGLGYVLDGSVEWILFKNYPFPQQGWYIHVPFGVFWSFGLWVELFMFEPLPRFCLTPPWSTWSPGGLPPPPNLTSIIDPVANLSGFLVLVWGLPGCTVPDPTPRAGFWRLCWDPGPCCCWSFCCCCDCCCCVDCFCWPPWERSVWFRLPSLQWNWVLDHKLSEQLKLSQNHQNLQFSICFMIQFMIKWFCVIIITMKN